MGELSEEDQVAWRLYWRGGMIVGLAAAAGLVVGLVVAGGVAASASPSRPVGHPAGPLPTVVM
jgi:hypothetical protein